MRTDISKSKVLLFSWVLMLALMLAACKDTQKATSSDNDIYLSQFGAFENTTDSLNDNLDNTKDNTLGAEAFSDGGEKLYEETLFDGKPVVVQADNNVTSPDSTTSSAIVGSVSTFSNSLTATAVTSADGQNNNSTNIENPTQNNTTSTGTGTSSDTGSGVTQTCDDPADNPVNNSSSNNTITATLE